MSRVPDRAPSAEEVRAALDELLGWQGISRSPQVSELLRYVIDKTLAGDQASIKAYAIAVDVFGRPQSFDPQSDPIVRVQARRLRTLLEQYYESRPDFAGVQIRLPLGRYVPEFVRVASQGTTEAGADPPAALIDPRPPPRRLDRFLFNAFLGLVFTLAGVGLAIGLIRWVGPAPTGPVAAMPDIPSISIGPFDNLTGEPALDSGVAQLGPGLATALQRFDAISVTTSGGTFSVSGAVQKDKGAFAVRAILSRAGEVGETWNLMASAPIVGSEPDALATAVVGLAAQLGNATGPLHASGRAWLKSVASPPSEPNRYVCVLEYMVWRDSRRLEDADAAIDCLDRIVTAQPDSAASLAAQAGLRAWRVQFVAGAGDDLVGLMAKETTDAARAVSLAPQSSFVYEQQALVLARQGSLDAALGAMAKSVELNPANVDARAIQGLLLWLNGDFEEGYAESEAAIAQLPTAPPWYYMTRAFNALRERRYFDAIEAGQALAASDAEFGPAIALAAAPAVGRTDLTDRYRPIILGYAPFQQSGVIPRLGMLIKPKILLERIRDGLVLAGVPPAALDGPFNPDGTAR